MAEPDKKTKAQQLLYITPHIEREPDGVGYLTVTLSYEAIDREYVKSISTAIRVRKGPVLSKSRSLVRADIQKSLDEMFDYIEQTETPDEAPSAEE